MSIIDPMSLNIELNKVQDQQNSSAGLLDAACYEDRPPILEVGLCRLGRIVNDLVLMHRPLTCWNITIRSEIVISFCNHAVPL